MTALIARFNAFRLRERIGIALALVAVVYLVFDATLLGPHTKKHKALKNEVAAVENSVAAAQAEMVVVKAQFDKDPQAKDRAQLDAYKKAMEEADAFIAKVESDPKLVGGLLRQILSGSPGLTLVSLRTMPPVAVIKSTSGESRTMYKRGIELTIKGNYLALLPYLEKLRSAPMRVLWAEAELAPGNYPDSNLKLVIYTLSSQAEATLG